MSARFAPRPLDLPARAEDVCVIKFRWLRPLQQIFRYLQQRQFQSEKEGREG